MKEGYNVDSCSGEADYYKLVSNGTLIITTSGPIFTEEELVGLLRPAQSPNILALVIVWLLSLVPRKLIFSMLRLRSLLQ
jgi:hypothetical protein